MKTVVKYCSTKESIEEINAMFKDYRATVERYSLNEHGTFIKWETRNNETFE